MLNERAKRFIRNYSVQTKQAHVKNWRSSGLTMSSYCRQHDLAVATFSTWTAKYKEDNKIPFIAVERANLPADLEASKNAEPLVVSISLPNQITCSIKVNRDVKFLVHMLRELCS